MFTFTHNIPRGYGGLFYHPSQYNHYMTGGQLVDISNVRENDLSTNAYRPTKNFNEQLQAFIRDIPVPQLQGSTREARNKYREDMVLYNNYVKNKEREFMQIYKDEILGNVERRFIEAGYTKDKNGIWRKPLTVQDLPWLDTLTDFIPNSKEFLNNAMQTGERFYENPNLENAIELGNTAVNAWNVGKATAEKLVNPKKLIKDYAIQKGKEMLGLGFRNKDFNKLDSHYNGHRKNKNKIIGMGDIKFKKHDEDEILYETEEKYDEEIEPIINEEENNFDETDKELIKIIFSDDEFKKLSEEEKNDFYETFQDNIKKWYEENEELINIILNKELIKLKPDDEPMTKELLEDIKNNFRDRIIDYDIKKEDVAEAKEEVKEEDKKEAYEDEFVGNGDIDISNLITDKMGEDKKTKKIIKLDDVSLETIRSEQYERLQIKKFNLKNKNDNKEEFIFMSKEIADVPSTKGYFIKTTKEDYETNKKNPYYKQINGVYFKRIGVGEEKYHPIDAFIINIKDKKVVGAKEFKSYGSDGVLAYDKKANKYYKPALTPEEEVEIINKKIPDSMKYKEVSGCPVQITKFIGYGNMMIEYKKIKNEYIFNRLFNPETNQTIYLNINNNFIPIINKNNNFDYKANISYKVYDEDKYKDNLNFDLTDQKFLKENFILNKRNGTKNLYTGVSKNNKTIYNTQPKIPIYEEFEKKYEGEEIDKEEIDKEYDNALKIYNNELSRWKNIWEFYRGKDEGKSKLLLY
jgi:hypothetical protein